MKKLIFYSLPFFLFIFLFSACEQELEFEADELRASPELQQDVFNLIASDQDMLNNFFGTLSQQPQEMQQLVNNQQFLQQAFSEQNLQTMLQQNPQMLETMMSNLMSAVQADTTMQQRMRQNPRMREMMQGMDTIMQDPLETLSN
jgi:lipopolysaccharide biosynthesis regulator YciM